MNANPVLLQMKYARIIKLFSKAACISDGEALEFFYTSALYKLVSEGVSDLHCMSDDYLKEELLEEYNNVFTDNKR